MNSPFTCNDLVLCHQVDAPYFMEYLEMLCGDVVPVFIYSDATPVLTDAEKRYICVRRVPFNILPAVTVIPVVFINTEHLTAPRSMVEFNAYAASSRVGIIYDFSHKNVELAKGRSVHLPLRECRPDTVRLQAFVADVDQGAGKIACVGTTTPYRIGIINGLRERGLSVDFVEVFGEERDRRVAACRLLLNLHAGKHFKPWEALRCDRWRYAGMLVVSEPCDADVPALVAANGTRNAVVFVSTDDLDAMATTLRSQLTSSVSSIADAAPLEAGTGTRPSGGAAAQKKSRRQARRK